MKVEATSIICGTLEFKINPANKPMALPASNAGQCIKRKHTLASDVQ